MRRRMKRMRKKRTMNIDGNDEDEANEEEKGGIMRRMGRKIRMMRTRRTGRRMRRRMKRKRVREEATGMTTGEGDSIAMDCNRLLSNDLVCKRLD